MRETLLTVVVPLVIVLLSIPLILRKIPRNYFYGLRTPRTLASDEVWYPANRFTGVALLCAGAAWLLAGALAPPEQLRAWVLVIGLGTLFVAVAASFIYLAFLPRSGRPPDGCRSRSEK